jgi:pantoate--beta-alanine ligase
MEIVNRVSRMASISAKLLADGIKSGMVSTMGAIHPGHVSLVQAAREMADLVIVSIFVNRLVFSSEEEFKEYPRDLMKDADLLRQQNADYVFAPGDEDMYPDGFGTSVQVAGTGRRNSGWPDDPASRGLATAALKMIHIIRPSFLFVGQKDAGKAAVLRKMIRDLNLGTEVIAAPVARDSTGLAYSARNRLLSESERSAATVIYRSLQAAARLVCEGETRPKAVIAQVAEVIAEEPKAQLGYAVVLDPETLDPLSRIRERALIGVEARIGNLPLKDSLTAEKVMRS